MPVLPLVGSMITEPGLSTPCASIASIIEAPMRSLTLASGLKNSSLASTSPFGFSSAVRRGRRTSGVSPMVSTMEFEDLAAPGALEAGGVVVVSSGAHGASFWATAGRSVRP